MTRSLKTTLIAVTVPLLAYPVLLLAGWGLKFKRYDEPDWPVWLSALHFEAYVVGAVGFIGLIVAAVIVILKLWEPK